MQEIWLFVVLLAIAWGVYTKSFSQFLNIFFVAAGIFILSLFLSQQIPWYTFILLGFLLCYLQDKVNLKDW